LIYREFSYSCRREACQASYMFLVQRDIDRSRDNARSC